MAGFKICIVVALLATLAVVSNAQGDMCGMAAPDPTKTCVSIRLPWNPQPMYFCTEKAKFRYRNQCQNRFPTHCGVDTIRNDILLIATPWDCCPLVSYPDSCVNQQCPPPPHERKCQTMEPSPNEPWQCCNSYFCEENVTPETCHFKRLEPACNTPPQGKMNCIAFVDQYGCCPKFQCDGDAGLRPGHCPAQVEAMNFMNRFNSTNNMVMMMGPGGHMMMPPQMAMGPGPANMGGAPPNNMGPQAAAQETAPPPPPPPAAPEGGDAAPPAERAGAGLSAKAQVAGGSFIGIPHTPSQIACIGDFNCPGTLKCCSHDMNVYVMDGRYVFRNRNPTYGYCMEPAKDSVTKRNNELM
ncbi:hypothetical protein Ocin01_18414 [Orchesella cincta]|uniref:WAP domain-containing protein n=1 Tax=Orchesella cincta TaxID=48709 RepID=A0A1D2M5K4_ORCCI|nr:hypothetical protein Ocin01_18414 [Orchesella cincta]